MYLLAYVNHLRRVRLVGKLLEKAIKGGELKDFEVTDISDNI